MTKEQVVIISINLKKDAILVQMSTNSLSRDCGTNGQLFAS